MAAHDMSGHSNQPAQFPSEELVQVQLIAQQIKGPITPRRPQSARYRRLIAELEKASREARDGQDDLLVILRCLVATLQFIDEDPEVRATGLTRFLGTLAAAIRDVLIGAKPSLFFDRPNGPGRPTGRSFEAVRGAVAAAVDMLIEGGEPPRDAGNFVADELHRANVMGPLGKAITARQVLRWRHNLGGTAPALRESAYKDVRAQYDRIIASSAIGKERRRNLVRGAILAIGSMGIPENQ
jgi:hypothetical protein